MKGCMYVELSVQMWFRLAKHFLTFLYILHTLIETLSKTGIAILVFQEVVSKRCLHTKLNILTLFYLKRMSSSITFQIET